MSPPHGFDEISARPQDFQRVFGRMASVLWRPEMARWRPRMAAALVITVAAKGLAVLAPVLMGDGINKVVSGEGEAWTAALPGRPGARTHAPATRRGVRPDVPPRGGNRCRS